MEIYLSAFLEHILYGVKAVYHLRISCYYRFCSDLGSALSLTIVSATNGWRALSDWVHVREYVLEALGAMMMVVDKEARGSSFRRIF